MNFFLLFFVFAFSLLCASETDEKRLEKIETTAQIAAVGLFGYGAWQAIKTWNNPELGQLYTDLVGRYATYLDTCEPDISSWYRFFKISYFKSFEVQRQLVLPILGMVLGAEIVLLIVLYKLKRQAEKQELQEFINDVLAEKKVSEQATLG